MLDEIKGGEGDAAERVFQRSFDLPQLGDDGRAALLALSLFAPDASRKALAATAGFGDNLRRLDKAVAKLSSLWLIETTERNERLLLRGLTRQLSKSRLARDERVVDFRRQFVTHFLAYAEAHMQHTGEDFDALGAEKDNLLSAQSVAFEGQDWLRVTRIRFALNEFLDVRGYWGEAIITGEQALQAARLSRNESEISIMSHNLAIIYKNRGELTAARRLYSESLEIDKSRGDQRGVAISLHQLAMLAQNAGDYEEARRLYAESLEIKKRLGDQRGIAITLHALAILLMKEGRLKEARHIFEESLEITKKLADKSNLALIFYNMGLLAEKEDDKTEAVRLLKDAVGIFEELGSPHVKVARRDLERITDTPS